jgi:hypothetical protein
MSSWSEKSIRDKAAGEQEAVARLVSAGKEGEAAEYILRGARKGIADLLDLPYQGITVRETDEYKTAKRLTDKLFAKVWKVYWGSAPFPLPRLMDFGDADYMVSLYQGLDALGLYNAYSATMDERLKTWFVMGFYAFQYELAAKPLVTYTQVLKPNGSRTVGDAVSLLKTKYQVGELAGYFDPFLRNAIDHSQYYVKDPKTGKVEAWNVIRGKKSPKRTYELREVFQMTVMLLFFVVAYYVSWYELMIELARRGAFRKVQ